MSLKKGSSSCGGLNPKYGSRFHGSEVVPGNDLLLSCFHVGWDHSSGRQTFKSLVGVVDKNPVLVLVVSLWVVAGGHW